MTAAVFFNREKIEKSNTIFVNLLTDTHLLIFLFPRRLGRCGVDADVVLVHELDRLLRGCPLLRYGAG